MPLSYYTYATATAFIDHAHLWVDEDTQLKHPFRLHIHRFGKKPDFDCFLAITMTEADVVIAAHRYNPPHNEKVFTVRVPLSELPLKEKETQHA